MMRTIFTITLALYSIIPPAVAQSVPSDCTVTQEVRDRYVKDAHLLALKYIFQTKSSDTDNAVIRTTLVDTMLRAFAAVYHADNLPARDTVTDRLHIHAHDASGSLQMLGLTVWDKQAVWASELEQGIFPTSDPDVNALITTYKLRQTNFYRLNSFISIDFESDSLFNMYAVAKQWEMIYSVGATSGFILGSGNYIWLDTLTPTYIDLTFSYGWGDCPMGCISRRNWYFRIYTTDCTVEFIKSTGADLSTDAVNDITGEPGTGIFPNPCSDYIRIPEPWHGAMYKLINNSGQSVTVGRLSDKLEIASLPPGIYYLQITTAKRKETVKLLKQ